MDFYPVNYEEIPKFSTLVKDYLKGDAKIDEFVEYNFDMHSIPDIITQSKDFKVNRALLKSQVVEEYKGFELGSVLSNNIQRLSDSNTFTVTTAHQLVLLSGPLYFIYKICNVIALSRKLNNQYPNQHFVPVFWMGSEDHDFEEINHINLSGNKIEWLSDFGGATGEYPTDSMNSFFASIKEFFANDEEAIKVVLNFEKMYSNAKNLTEASFTFLHHLFGKYGLVIVDGNKAAFKKVFAPIMKSELFDRNTDGLVKTTQQRLIEVGYHAQATSRDINLFYKTTGSRERIIYEDGLFKVNHTDIHFSNEAILEELNSFPERFSPNVILRPLYQQSVLPNVMYVGGGGELAYWMQLKNIFHFYKVQYPMLVLRTSAHIVSKSIHKKISKFNLPLTAYFEDIEEVKKKYIASTDEEGVLDIGEELESIREIISSLQSKANKVDASLVSWVGAEGSKLEKSLESISARLTKTKKQQIEVQLQQLEKIVQSFTPNNSLQERIENFLPYFVRYKFEFIETLIENLDTMEKQFTLVEEQ